MSHPAGRPAPDEHAVAMTRVPAPRASGSGRHAVQSYRADDELAAAGGGYLAEGLRSGDGILVATAPRRQAFEDVLDQAGILPRDRGQVALAVEMGALRNGLGALLPFALCEYPAGMPAGGDTADAAREVCGLRLDVIATRSFPPSLDSVRGARRLTVGLLDHGPYSELAEDAAIVATELAANAVLHARSGFTLTISQSAAAVRITVRDNRPLVPRSDGRPFDIKAGHGLSVVVQLARAWAVERLPGGKAVSAELALDPG